MESERGDPVRDRPPYLVGYNCTNHPGTTATKNTDWSETYGVTWDEADATKNSDLYDRFIKTAIEVAIHPNAA